MKNTRDMPLHDRRIAAPGAGLSALRWAVSIPASVQEHQWLPLPVSIVDISISGCRIQTGCRMTPGCPARLLIAGIPPIRSAIVWVRDWYAALAFDTELHPTLLRRLVAGYPPYPDGAEWIGQSGVTSNTAPSSP